MKAALFCPIRYNGPVGRSGWPVPGDDERPEAVAAALPDFAIRRDGYLVNAKRGNLYP
jgi:hypothetical protein